MKRPLLVTVIGVIMIVLGGLQALFGVLFFTQRNDTSFLASADVTTSELTSIAIVTMLFGVVSILLGLGLLRGSRIVRALVGIFEVFQIAGAIWTIVKLDSGHWGGAIGTIVGALVILYFLFGTDKAKEFFAR